MGDQTYAAIADRYRTDMTVFNAADDAHHDALARMATMRTATRPAAPVVVLTAGEAAAMADVDVTRLYVDLGTPPWTSHEELFLAWTIHSPSLGSAWAKVDGTPLMYSHVASAVLRLRLGVERAQCAAGHR